MSIGNAVMSLVMPSAELWLVKDGVFQPGFESNLWASSNQKKYTSNESTVNANIAITYPDGYVQFRASSSQNRRSAVYYSPAISSINDYDYMVIRCKRYSGTTAGNMRVGAFYIDLNTYAKYCFYGSSATANSGDEVESTTTDSDIVTLQIALLNSHNQQTPVCFGYAQAIPASGTNGIDLYDVYLTNTPIS